MQKALLCLSSGLKRRSSTGQERRDTVCKKTKISPNVWAWLYSVIHTPDGNRWNSGAKEAETWQYRKIHPGHLVNDEDCEIINLPNSIQAKDPGNISTLLSTRPGTWQAS